VLLLHLFEALGLIDLLAAIILTQAIVLLPGDTDLTNSHLCMLAIAQQDLNFTQLGNDLFRLATLFPHMVSPLANAHMIPA
jgi:hypothetical protein